jgi:hypothetical protein
MLRMVEQRAAARRAAEQRTVDAGSNVLGGHSARRRAAQTSAQGNAPSTPVAVNPSTGPTIGLQAGATRTLPQAGPSRTLLQTAADTSRTIPGAGISVAEDDNARMEGLEEDAEGEDEV